MNLKEFGLTEKQVRKILSGRNVKPRVLKEAITNKEFEFGVIGDTHLGSHYEAINELHTFYAICEKMGIKHVLHAGDLLDGHAMYPGWENEVHTFGADRQVYYAVKNYPLIKGITTYFINGNHDNSFYKKTGIDTGKMIASERKDMVYLGQDSGMVEIGGVRVRLIHPSGGVPYARSYRGQKIAEQIPSGEKPQILCIGHLHISLYFFYRLISILQCGCFQWQTPYLMRKGLNPDVGGWTIKVRIADDKKKSVVAIVPAYIPFFGGAR